MTANMFLYTMGLLKKSWRQVNLRNHEVNDPVCVCAVPLGWLALVMRHWWRVIRVVGQFMVPDLTTRDIYIDADYFMSNIRNENNMGGKFTRS